VRWVGLGIGYSTVPDLQGVGLMGDRATLRISSQEIANWLHHGVVDEAQVRDTFARMAVLVDEHNAREPGYKPMSKDPEHNPSFQAALELVFAGRQEPTATPNAPSPRGGGRVGCHLVSNSVDVDQ
jgi:malate synthase